MLSSHENEGKIDVLSVQEIDHKLISLENSFKDHLVISEKRLSSLEELIRGHEKSCNSFRTLTYAAATILVTIIMAMAGQILLITGRQEVVMQRLDAHRELAINSELRIRHDIDAISNEVREVRIELQKHVSGKQP
jgi:hypothetical protein